MDYQAASMNGHVQNRIRTPNPHDVLSGRGGGINSHIGNITFRQWVAERKNDYNLAPSKAQKSRVAQEVIDLVQSQNPPGRFLHKDASGGGSNPYWVELDDERRMAKTSQALREGAPQIRAAHREELEENKLAGRRRKKPSMATRHSIAVPASTNPIRYPKVDPNTLNWSQQRVMAQLQANVERAKRESLEHEDYKPMEKRLCLPEEGRQTVTPQEDSPLLAPMLQADLWPSSMDLVAMPAPPKQERQTLPRMHSLALSDLGTSGDWATEDFINPFASESEIGQKYRLPESTSSESFIPPPPRPGVLQHETSSNGDMGGIGALRRQSSSTSIGSKQRQLSRSSFGSLSNLFHSSSSNLEASNSNGADNSRWDFGLAAPVSP